MEEFLKYAEPIATVLGFGISTVTLVLGYIQYRANQKQKNFEDIYNLYLKNEKLIAMMYKYVYDLDNKDYKKIKSKDYVYVEQLLTTFEYLCDLHYENKIDKYNFSYVKDELNYLKNSKAITNFIKCEDGLYPSLKKYWKEEK